MERTYSHKRKEKIAGKISKIKRKKDLVKIFEIIQEEDSKVTENNNGLFSKFNSHCSDYTPDPVKNQHKQRSVHAQFQSCNPFICFEREYKEQLYCRR